MLSSLLLCAESRQEDSRTNDKTMAKNSTQSSKYFTANVATVDKVVGLLNHEKQKKQQNISII